MGFEPNEERTVDNLPETRFEGGGADIDGNDLSAASPVAAPKRARLSVRPRSAAETAPTQDDAAPVRKGMPPRTEEHTPPPVRRPIMRPSSEFGYLFSDEEPVDNHMDDSYSRRLDGLAYDGRKQEDDAQYADLMDGSQPSMVRRPENRMSAESASPRSRQEQPAERPSRFSRRSRTAPAQETEPTPEVMTEPALQEQANEAAPAEEHREHPGDEYRPRRRYEGDDQGYDPRERRRSRPYDPRQVYGPAQAAYPPYGQYPAAYPPGYGYPPYGYPVQPGYPPYGYPVQPGYAPYGYPMQAGYPAYVYPVQPGAFPPGMMPMQPAVPEQPAPEQPQTVPSQTESQTEEEIPPHPMPPMSLLPKAADDSRTNSAQAAPVRPDEDKKPAEEKPAEAKAAEEKKPAQPQTSARESNPASQPASAGGGSSRFNRRTHRTDSGSGAAPASTQPAQSSAPPAGDANDRFGSQHSPAGNSGSQPGGERPSRFNRRSK